MNSRFKKIIKCLLGTSDVLTSTDLATTLNVSSKTVRNDIKELNGLLLDGGYSKIESFRGKGYKLTITDEMEFKQFLHTQIENDDRMIPTEPTDRVQFLIEKLLLQSSYLKMDDLADELYVSRSTLQSDLNHVRALIEDYHLTLDHKPNYGIKVIGEEMQIRFCISEHIFNQKSAIFDQTADWLEILPKDEIEIVKVSILSKLREHKIITSDISLNNLITHIIIACKRIRENNTVELFHEELERISTGKEYAVAKEIVEEIEEKLNVKFLPNEIAYLAIHLLGTKMIHEEDKIEVVNKVIDRDIQQLAKDIVHRIDEKYFLNLYGDEELILALTLHLMPAINRYKYDMNLRNPMLSEIKSMYPLSFEAALSGAAVIEEKMDISIDEGEIGYMALHIEVALERQKKKETKLRRCLIVCASGLGTAQLLLFKLKDKFSDQLNIMGTTEYYNLNNQSLHNIDFIISTIPIRKQLPIPVIQVSTLLGNKDISNIERLINDDIDLIDKYMRKPYTFLKMDFNNKEDVIHFLGGELLKNGLVSEQFTESVLEREKISPTSFGNLVAIPHPIEPQTDDTFWSILTLNSPIQWGDKPVRIVFLLNIAKENTEDLKAMYGTLVKLLDNEFLLKELLDCSTYHEFKKVLKKNEMFF